MSSLIPGQEAMHLCFGFVFIGLAVAAHTAQSEEGTFAPNPDILTTQIVRSDADWLLNRINVNDPLTRPEDSALPRPRFNNTPQMLVVVEPKNKAAWITDALRQITPDRNCSSLQPLRICVESKEERLEFKPRHDSVWVVWRKVLPF